MSAYRLLKRRLALVIVVIIGGLSSLTACGDVAEVGNCSGPFDYVHNSHHVPATMNTQLAAKCYQPTYQYSATIEIEQRNSNYWSRVAVGTQSKYNVLPGQSLKVTQLSSAAPDTSGRR